MGYERACYVPIAHIVSVLLPSALLTWTPHPLKSAGISLLFHETEREEHIPFAMRAGRSHIVILVVPFVFPTVVTGKKLAVITNQLLKRNTLSC